MLLETLDIEENDIIIYSQNIFNLENNFKIILKDDKEKLVRNISFEEVCRFVNEFTPKNLIVYRLLTNIKDFKIEPSKYGYMLNINDQTELVYFDPVFAVKELERYTKFTNLSNLRFRIQQVGLTTLSSKRNLPNYAEIYAIDLEAMEAKFQNDKVFADAIISIDSESKNATDVEAKVPAESNLAGNKKSEKTKAVSSFADKIKQTQEEVTTERKESIKQIQHQISEDKDFNYTEIMKMNFKNKDFPGESAGHKGIPVAKAEDVSSPFSEFLRKKRLAMKEGSDKKEKRSFTDLFKSSAPLKEYINSKEDKKVVLRLDKK